MLHSIFEEHQIHHSIGLIVLGQSLQAKATDLLCQWALSILSFSRALALQSTQHQQACICQDSSTQAKLMITMQGICSSLLWTWTTSQQAEAIMWSIYSEDSDPLRCNLPDTYGQASKDGAP